MQDYRNDRSGGSRGRKPFSVRGSGDREMFDAVCAECGNHCQVPFMPSNGKPVYCSNCFEKVEAERDGGRAPRRNNFDRPQSDRPRYDKPAYSPRRDMPQAAPKVNFDELNEKFEELNNKLDLILHTLAHPAETTQAE